MGDELLLQLGFNVFCLLLIFWSTRYVLLFDSFRKINFCLIFSILINFNLLFAQIWKTSNHSILLHKRHIWQYLTFHLVNTRLIQMNIPLGTLFYVFAVDLLLWFDVIIWILTIMVLIFANVLSFIIKGKFFIIQFFIFLRFISLKILAALKYFIGWEDL